MNKISKRIFISTIISIIIIGKTATASPFTDELVKYCIPTNENSCSGNTKVTYNSTLSDTNKCECQQEGFYYDTTPTVRACKPCPEGTVTGTARNLTSCKPIQCPSGYKLVKINAGQCPTGFKLKTITNNACQTGYKKYNFPS